MSKSTNKRTSRAEVERMQREARAAERRRTSSIVAVCVVIALLVVGVAGYQVWSATQARNALAGQQLADMGATVTGARCTPVKTQPARGQGQHVTTPVIYDTVPPAFGPHYPTPDESGHHFYTAADRPRIEILVHNLEHGWTIVWYDESVAANSSQMDLLKAVAHKFDAHGNNPRFHMIIAPWTKTDGEGRPIPDGKHIAFTHWSIHQPVYKPPASNQPPKSYGESQYCTSFSGTALQTFMKKYPYDDAPEGYLWHQ